MTKNEVDGMLGPQFKWREDASRKTIVVRPPVDMTEDDARGLQELRDAAPVWLAIEIEGSVYR